uniref:Uncharacterized protein n=1 Tax=Arundo donax TaxID=35708 RepID=A0A0A8YMR8_ARUDO
MPLIIYMRNLKHSESYIALIQ